MIRKTMVGALAAVLLAAGAAQAQTKVTFRFSDTEADRMRHALDAFEQAHPSIKVDMQRLAWPDARAQYLREAAVGSAPDVVEIVYVWTRPFGNAKALRPLDDLIQKTGIGVKGWSDFIAADLAKGSDGKVYAIPYATDTFAIIYNKDLLKQAGYDVLPKDWKTFREASAAVAAKTGKSGFVIPSQACATSPVWFFLNFYWWSKGHALIDQDKSGKYVIGITPEQIAEGFDYFNAFFKEGHSPKSMLSVCSFGAPEIVEGMIRGDIAMASMADWAAARVINGWRQRFPDKPLPFATAPHPADVNGSRTHFGGRMLGISPNARNVEQAWELIRYLAQPDPAFTKYLTTYTPSQMAAVQAKHVAPEMQGFVEQLKTARSWGAYATGPVQIPTMWNATGRAASAVFVGEKTSAQAAQELYDLLAKELAKAK
jgi:ABC-type glycerol-3-phosphate transport system substrate-binding protein